VGVVQGKAGHIGVDSSLLEGQDSLNLLVELVGCAARKTCLASHHHKHQLSLCFEILQTGPSLTGILGLGHNLGQELGEVGQIIAQEAGLDDESLAGVRGSQLASEKLRLAVDAQGRSSLGGL
jgi:hypothetical protein